MRRPPPLLSAEGRLVGVARGTLSSEFGTYHRRRLMPALHPRVRRWCTAPAWAIAVLAIAACHNVNLSPEAKAVRVIRDASQVRSCRFVSDVESSDRLSGGLVNRDKAEENAYKILKEKTAKLGANTVLISSATSNYRGAGMQGKAYACAT